MIHALSGFLSNRSTLQITAMALLLVTAIGIVDYLTGYELAFSIFYVIPVGISSWYAGRRIGIPISIISAATWLAGDHLSGHTYSHLALLFWNTSVRLGFFFIIAYLLGHLRNALEFQAFLAQHDGLTGILNARTFRQRCEWVAQLAARHSHPLTLGYLDLDGFKGVNDNLGHGTGDQILRAVATALSDRLRVSDLAGRLGGDEFAVLLPETDLQGAQTFFTEMRECLLELAAQNHWAIGFSIGVAVFHATPVSLEDAIRCADDLMYRVKRTGKNKILIEEYPLKTQESGGSQSSQ